MEVRVGVAIHNDSDRVICLQQYHLQVPGSSRISAGSKTRFESQLGSTCALFRLTDHSNSNLRLQPSRWQQREIQPRSSRSKSG
jgi:hypothetical protein